MLVSTPDANRLGGPSWSVSEFVLVILAGLAGAFVAAAWLLATDPSDAVWLLASSIAMSAGHLLGLALVLRRHRSRAIDIGLDVVGADGRYLLAGGLLQLVTYYLFLPLMRLLESQGNPQVVADQIADVRGTFEQVMVILVVGLVAPVTEELVFRGLLLKALQERMRPVSAVVVSAAVFGVIHVFGIDGDNVLAGIITIGQLFVVGLVLGEMTRRTGRLGPAIFTHAGFNLLAVAALLFAPQLGTG